MLGKIKMAFVVVGLILIGIYLGSRVISDPSGAAIGIREVLDATGRALNAIWTFVTTLAG